jgi:FkbM family methyltransferase
MKFRKYFYYFFSIIRLFFGIKNFPLVVKIFLKKETNTIKQITLRKMNIKFHIRGAMDIWSIKETFLDRFYEKYGTKILNNWIIIDIGAGIGDFSLFAIQKDLENIVYAFEPCDESYELLESNLVTNNARNIYIYREAVGGKTGKIFLDITSGEPLQYSTTNKSSQENGRLVNCVSLEDVFERLSLEQCNLLKIDCEGCEYDIIFNTPKTILRKISHIVAEYHDGFTNYNHNDLVKYLINQGFLVKVEDNPVHNYLGFLHAYQKESSNLS